MSSNSLCNPTCDASRSADFVNHSSPRAGVQNKSYASARKFIFWPIRSDFSTSWMLACALWQLKFFSISKWEIFLREYLHLKNRSQNAKTRYQMRWIIRRTDFLKCDQRNYWWSYWPSLVFLIRRKVWISFFHFSSMHCFFSVYCAANVYKPLR